MRMIDADALLRDMETLWDWPTVNGIQTDTALRQVMADIRNAPTVGEWVRTDCRLPDRGVTVLTAIIGTDVIVQKDGETMDDAVRRSQAGPARVSIGWIGDDGLWYGSDGWPEIVQPSYWMELPEAPGNTGKEEWPVCTTRSSP